MFLGLGGLGAGGAAVFITRVEAGPVALLIVGLLLLLIGMAGRLPSRIRIGDNEAAWEAFTEFVEKVADRTPPENQATLLADLTELARDAPQAASAGLSAIAYEQLVTRMVYDAFVDLPEKPVGSVSAPGPDAGFDMVLNTDARMVVFQVKYSSYPISTRTLIAAANTRERLAEGSDETPAFIVVSATRLTQQAVEILRSLEEMFVVVVRGPEDRDQLIAAVRAALGVLPPDGRRYFIS
jgi:hypothetical protein